MRIGIDAMGGDCAPEETVKGAVLARRMVSDGDRVVLIGDESAIRACLAKAEGPLDHIEIRHTDQAIGMDEPPVEALRNKPDSSIALMAQMHKDGEVDACISAGNTGACVAAAQMRLRRLRERQHAIDDRSDRAAFERVVYVHNPTLDRRGAVVRTVVIRRRFWPASETFVSWEHGAAARRA
jgi:fatty acid/phospholipid biosynthesis enzyme